MPNTNPFRSLAAAALSIGAGLLTLAAPAHAEDGEEVTIAAPAGSVRGEADGDVVSFKGIPYAAPPVGELRWQPPQEPAAWDGVRDGTKFGPACYQPTVPGAASSIYHEELGPMSEDCLSLNIWAPEDAANAPVFVWIHGGALVSGTSAFDMYDGSRMAQQGVVVVSINYRLGALGFLAHPELSAESPDGVSGNYGLMDQIAALRWIEANIAAFGGDPDNVTIVGESAGALSVMWLMTAPPAKGLFDKAIMQSAYMISSPALKEAEHGHPSAESIGTWLQEQLDAPDLAALRKMEPGALVNRATRAGFLTWTTVDGKLIPHQIAETFDRGEQAQVPLIAGFNSGEIRSLRRLLPPAPNTRTAYEEKIRELYGDLADVFLALYPPDNVDESMLAATRDALYGWTAERLARKQTAAAQDAFLYLFDHGYPEADEAGLHAFHASEIPFVFGTIHDTAPNWPQIPRTAEQRALSDAMLQYWTTFARDGAPSAHGQIDWPAYGPEGAFVLFDGTAQAGSQLLGTRYALNEAVVCRRRAAGDQPWHWNVGIASPPLPPRVTGCQ
ncbi:carboxylesterase/lipase family protein [Alteriqipengyuania lutimaris]|uniref:Carboxylic ester hydrolase n=1 Tax=Alteriqipengyuania lutimaris TaxID=1538146 RepID=A0A395LNV9_9SPHN|nr:carboxylesterase family protein [Alteriqipengyuania lutimaris]MBB3032517.1 para-nitrobenzyl esterase [Alteriqipengyuania lutimaris]RDS78349.1 carboxylesterase family protein [Alteriqipengyuania lutimaris]